MKKIILSIVLLLSLFLYGCTEEVTTTARDTSGRELLFEMIDDFNGLLNVKDYENLEWEDEKREFYGEANLVLYYDNVAAVILFDGSKAILVEIYVDENETNSLYTAVYEIDIYYQDFENEISVTVWYCYQGDLFHKYMENKSIPMNLNSLLELMSTITMEDYQWLLVELGYNVILEPIIQGAALGSNNSIWYWR